MVDYFAPGFTLVGDEVLNEAAMGVLEPLFAQDERLMAASGFDWATKVIAVTSHRVMVADDSGGLVFHARYPELRAVQRHDGRTLLLRLHAGGEEFRYRMGKDDTVSDLVRLIQAQRRRDAQDRREGRVPGELVPPAEPDIEEDVPPGIAERVRFWEEQDRINRELIPRVIRQNELLAGHIADHENLALFAAEAARLALAQVQDTIDRQMAESRKEREEQARLLEEARKERAAIEDGYNSAISESEARVRRVVIISVGISAMCAVIAGVAVAIALLG